MFSIYDYTIMGIGLILLLIGLIFYVVGLKDSWLFENEKLDGNFPLHQLYFMGFAMLKCSHYSFKTKHDRALKKQLAVLYDDEYIDYYLNVLYAERITATYILLLAGPIFYGLSGNIEALTIMALAPIIYVYIATIPQKKLDERSEVILADFSDVVSKLALMTNAGMVLHEAWKRVSRTGDTEIYRQMRRTVQDMDNGISEADALLAFGSRCMVPEIKKFMSTIIQDLNKGNSELVLMLQEQSKEVWSNKKQHIRRMGEKASAKLMLPIMVIFIGILIMIVVPIFTNLGS